MIRTLIAGLSCLPAISKTRRDLLTVQLLWLFTYRFIVYRYFLRYEVTLPSPVTTYNWLIFISILTKIDAMRTDTNKFNQPCVYPLEAKKITALCSYIARVLLKKLITFITNA